MPSLTRAEAETCAEAEARAEALCVRAYAVDLDVTGADEYTSTTSIDFACVRTQPAASFVEAKGGRIVRAVLNGLELDPAGLTLTVAAPPQWTVRGNAPGQQVRPGRWEFEATPPLSTYLPTARRPA